MFLLKKRGHFVESMGCYERSPSHFTSSTRGRSRVHVSRGPTGWIGAAGFAFTWKVESVFHASNNPKILRKQESSN